MFLFERKHIMGRLLCSKQIKGWWQVFHRQRNWWKTWRHGGLTGPYHSPVRNCRWNGFCNSWWHLRRTEVADSEHKHISDKVQNDNEQGSIWDGTGSGSQQERRLALLLTTAPRTDEFFKPLYIEQPLSPTISFLFSCLLQSFEWTNWITLPEQEQSY